MVNTEELYTLISPDARSKDPSSMLSYVVKMPQYLFESIEKYGETVAGIKGIEPERFEGVVISGMGGSFISGLFLQDLIIDRSKKQLVLNRDARLPSFVDERFLLINVSYSGNTEETLRVYLEGIKRKLSIVAVTSGGELATVSEKTGVPVIRVPPGIPPRAAFPFLTAAVVALASSVLGIDLAGRLKRASEELSEKLDRTITDGLALSRLLKEDVENGRVPLIYGYSPYLSPSYRFKTQLNENTKLHAFYGELPETNHNEIMGWGSRLNKFTVILVRGKEEPTYMTKRIEFLEKLFEKNQVPFYNIHGEGSDRAGELLSLVLKADITSVALSLLLGVDPTPVETISQLKSFLEAEARFSLSSELEK
ncbi:MAG: bifunctional phosphoglucose/phosphomannose isomerase [Infirmifilum sp.]